MKLRVIFNDNMYLFESKQDLYNIESVLKINGLKYARFHNTLNSYVYTVEINSEKALNIIKCLVDFEGDLKYFSNYLFIEETEYKKTIRLNKKEWLYIGELKKETAKTKTISKYYYSLTNERFIKVVCKDIKGYESDMSFDKVNLKGTTKKFIYDKFGASKVKGMVYKFVNNIRCEI